MSIALLSQQPQPCQLLSNDDISAVLEWLGDYFEEFEQTAYAVMFSREGDGGATRYEVACHGLLDRVVLACSIPFENRLRFHSTIARWEGSRIIIFKPVGRGYYYSRFIEGYGHVKWSGRRADAYAVLDIKGPFVRNGRGEEFVARLAREHGAEFLRATKIDIALDYVSDQELAPYLLLWDEKSKRTVLRRPTNLTDRALNVEIHRSKKRAVVAYDKHTESLDKGRIPPYGGRFVLRLEAREHGLKSIVPYYQELNQHTDGSSAVGCSASQYPGLATCAINRLPNPFQRLHLIDIRSAADRPLLAVALVYARCVGTQQLLEEIGEYVDDEGVRVVKDALRALAEESFTRSGIIQPEVMFENERYAVENQLATLLGCCPSAVVDVDAIEDEGYDEVFG